MGLGSECLRKSSSAADGGNNRNIRIYGNETRQPSGIANVFVADKNVDVFAHLALLGDDAIAEAGIKLP